MWVPRTYAEMAPSRNNFLQMSDWWRMDCTVGDLALDCPESGVEVDHSVSLVSAVAVKSVDRRDVLLGDDAVSSDGDVLSGDGDRTLPEPLHLVEHHNFLTMEGMLLVAGYDGLRYNFLAGHSRLAVLLPPDSTSAAVVGCAIVAVLC